MGYKSAEQRRRRYLRKKADPIWRERERKRLRRRKNRREHWAAPHRVAKSVERSRRWRAKYPGRVNAQAAARYAIEVGRLVRGVCAECGAVKVHAHHADYGKPLEVEWLCSRHHKLRHMEMGGA